MNHATYVVHHVQNDIQTNVQRVANPSKEEQRSNETNAARSTHLSSKEVTSEQVKLYNPEEPLIQVFKDHNCTEDGEEKAESKLERQETNSLNIPTYFQTNPANINYEFGAKLTDKPLTYGGAKDFKVEQPTGRQNSRSERLYLTFDSSTPTNIVKNITESYGISKLVASTQDLISNDDLLTINHAQEKYSQLVNDDVISPRSNYNTRPEQSNRYEIQAEPRTQITFRAKLGKIIDADVENFEDNRENVRSLQYNSDEYKFTGPIVVQDSTVGDFKEQMVKNIVSTVSPYLNEGYELSSIRNTLEDMNFGEIHSPRPYEDDMVSVTPRPIGQKYLAPITVALRLFNANGTDLNNIDEYEGSDSEIVSETVNPEKEKTVVEIQQSIPVSITHINDVEHHQYMEDGKSNDDDLYQKQTLMNQYVQALEFSKQIQQNMNENLYKHGTMKDYQSPTNELESNVKSSNGNSESSENIDSSIELQPDASSNNERREFVKFFTKNNHHHNRNRIIQPIVIEKEVPVTKYVDRIVEKEVKVPEPYEVIKEVEKRVFVPVPVETIVEKPYQVTQYVDKPYPVEVPKPYPVEVKVPYPVENKVFVDRPVPYPVEKIIEKQLIHQIPVPTPVAVPVEQKVLYPVPYEKRVPYAVEKLVPYETIVEKPYPVPYSVEKRVPYPVPFETRVPVPIEIEKRVPVPVPYEKIVEKPVTVTQVVEKPVHIQVPVPQPYAVPQPYPVERIVERKVPYAVPIDRVVEKRVPYQVNVPVDRVVEKIVEKPVVVTKYVDKPYPVERRVPYPVEKIVEKRVPYPVQIPYEVKIPYPVEKFVEKPVHVPYQVPYPVETYIPIPLRQSYAESQHQPQPPYRVYGPEQHRLGLPPPHLTHTPNYIPPYYKENKKPVSTTHWGNLYASSYQYINNTENQFRKSPQLAKYIDYLINSRDLHYYGPPPTMMAPYDWAQRSNNHFAAEMKHRRTDREPKMSNLRIEYGGFKPPLIPSTEVDLDGIPVHKET